MLTSGTKLGPYEIVSPLGAGGMGEVYRARDTRLGREVAIKVLPAQFASDPDRLCRFEREARAVAAFSHPNVITLYDVGAHEGAPYLVTELLQGESLRERLEGGALSVRKALEIAAQIAQGLGAAHESGIVHRDLKPENVFVTNDGHVKILDFGIAKLTHADAGPPATTLTSPQSTEPGAVMGTVGYLSPEQLRGLSADHRTDIFSLGCVLYEMLSGRRAFGKESAADTLSAILHEDPPPPPGSVPAKIAVMVARCLEKRPEDRFSSARDLALMLEGFLAGAPAAVAETTPAAANATLAVLPFGDLSPTRTLGHIGEGIAEEIINALVRVPGLRVLARTSTFQFGAPDADPHRVAAALGAGLVVTGSVRKAGRRLRVSTQLVDVSAGVHVWSEVFDRPASDLFVIEEEIAAAVARRASGEVAGAPSQTAVRRGTANPEALELYLRGRYLWSRRPGEVVWDALRCFEKAVRLDPAYAAALAGIADVYATLGSWESGVLPSGEAQAKAREYARRALTIDPTCSEAHTTLAYTAIHHDWDPNKAEAGFMQALDESPGNASAHHWYSHALAAAGRFAESLEASRRFQFFDPMNPLGTAHLSWHYFMARKPEQALEEAERVVLLDPGFHWGHYFLGWAAEGLGDLARAIDAMRAAERCSPGNPVMTAGIGRALAVGGERREALEIAATLARAGGEEKRFSYEIALIHLGLEEPEAALEWLESTHTLRGGWIAYIKVDPRLDPLRGNERFAALVPPTLG